MASAKTDILFPPGRMVWGDLYKARTTDFEGKPLVVKTGPNKGEPGSKFEFGVAIAKGAETHWASTAWGAIIWAAGHAGLAKAGEMPTFAWKVTDGDSTVPNRQSKKPCDREGYPGHWVVSFSSSFTPNVYQTVPGQKDPARFDVKGAVNPGDFIEVFGNVGYNESAGNPGVFINHQAICLRGYGDRIATGIDVGAIGFGAAAAPAGASAVPVGQALATPPVPGVPAAPAAPTAAVPQPTPNAAFLAPPPPTPTPPAPPAAAPQIVMTALAKGASYQSFIDIGWTHEAMVKAGYVV